MFPAPLCISSIISPVSSHPSPVWLPSETRSFARAAVSWILDGAVKRLLSFNAFVELFLNHSRILITELFKNADFFEAPR